MELAQTTLARGHNERRRQTAGQLALRVRPILEAQRKAVADARGKG